MLFDDKYPNAQVDDSISCDGDELIKIATNYVKRCRMCDNFACWVSVSFQSAFCSEECLVTIWNEYFDCIRNTPIREDLSDEFTKKGG